MRVYHYLNECYGLSALKDRKLKIGRIRDFNDPFEFSHLNFENFGTKQIIKERRKRANWDYGVICFSANYSNPVQWAHYADSHRGLCLGFDIPDNQLLEIEYSEFRSDYQEFQESLDLSGKDFVKFMLKKKFIHWQYEEEFRLVIPFSKRKKDYDLVFQDFSESIVLREIFIGARSTLTKKDVLRASSGTERPMIFRLQPSNSKFEMAKFGYEIA